MFEASLSLKGDEILLAASRDFQRRLPRTTLNAIRRGLRPTITDAKRDIRQRSGLGQTVWGRRATGLNTLISMIRARTTADTVVTGIKLKGLARLIEEGGRTLPHTIKPKNAERLAFEIAGRFVLAKKVNHPGSRIRPHGYAQTLLRGRGIHRITREVADAIAKLKAQVFSREAA